MTSLIVANLVLKALLLTLVMYLNQVKDQNNKGSSFDAVNHRLDMIA